MTRATLLATTAAILLPLTGAIAQETDSAATAGASASGEVSAQTETNSNNLTESVTDSADAAMEEVEETAEQAGQAAEETGEAAASTAADAVEDIGTATEEAADATAPAADAEAGMETDTAAGAEADAGASGSITAGELTGMPVIDATGEDIGEIDRVVSRDGGTAAVIGVGGFLGLGEREVAIPTADLNMNEEGQLELTGYTENDLGRLPEFEADGAQVLEDDQTVPDLG